METILTTQVSVPLSHIFVVFTVITLALIFGRLKMALFFAYCFLIYWGQLWDVSIFTESTTSKLNAPALLFISLCIFNVLLAMVGLVFHRD